ncbi:isopentenyl transferase family protein [Streptomyces sp. SAS_270]|uniref:isopentenyl transferase family protein n=1 Tax=Streptomyces sp. SAS_270 TaxID=3412748 RepID=UPI00403CD2BD
MTSSRPHTAAHPFVHLIAGPTGSGKSAAATELARVTGAPIVVADRLQCFTDLTTTSARAGAQAPGARRYWLDERTVPDGDLSADKAADALIALVARLGARHRFVIVEGGSISLLRTLTTRVPKPSWHLSVRLLPLPSRVDYLAALTRRAHEMIAPPSPGRSLLEELATLWREPDLRLFTASVNGFEAVLECCAKYALDVETIHEQPLSPPVVERMAALIAERHAEHGFLQYRVFAEMFKDHISGTGPGFDVDIDVLGDAA